MSEASKPPSPPDPSVGEPDARRFTELAAPPLTACALARAGQNAVFNAYVARRIAESPVMLGARGED